MEDNFIIYPETMHYLNEIHSFPDERLKNFEAFAKENECPIVQRDLALFIHFLVSLKQPTRILELGTNIGYSSTIMALASPESSIIETIEFKKENVEQARKFHKDFGFENKISVHYSDALGFLKNLSEEDTFDFVFIDANKKENQEYIERLVPHVPKGGLICVDNLLWKGRTTARSLVSEPSMNSTLEIRKFNRWVVEHPQFQTQLLPIGDGISLSLKR